MACAGLFAAVSLPGPALPITPVAPTDTDTDSLPKPSPELLAAHRVLDRLLSTTAIEAPITLVVRPFQAPTCALPGASNEVTPAPVASRPPAAPGSPSAQGPPAAAGPAPSAPGICLSGFLLPPRLRRGFFVPFVASLQRQSDPEHDPEQFAAAIEGRTIMLNASALALVPPPAPTGAQTREAPGGTLPPAGVCRLAEALAAVQLEQPRQRRESFDRIHTRLAERIHRITGPSKKGWSFVELLAFNLVTFGYFIPYGVVGYLEEIPYRNRGRWVNARLAESPHWQVLESQAPMVAAALRELRGLPEMALNAPDGPESSTVYGSPATTFAEAWRQIDGWFGIAAQEREEVIQAQRLQAEAEARRRLVAAGLEPALCAEVFLPAAVDEPVAAAPRPLEQPGGQALQAGPALPHRFLPGGQVVVIFPRPAGR